MLRQMGIAAAGVLLTACSAKSAVQQFATNIRDHASNAYGEREAARSLNPAPEGGGADLPRAPAGPAAAPARAEPPNPAAAQDAANQSAAIAAYYATTYQAAAAASTTPPPPAN